MLKIGFTSADQKDTMEKFREQTTCTVRKSLAEVYFPARGRTLTYYNDQFDLNVGDLVYVEGKLEGYLGRVTEINYNFKIKLSDYKRIINVLDTDVKGTFFMGGSHFITFDREALPSTKVLPWFKAPSAEEEFVSGSDNTSFKLDDLSTMNINPAAASSGHDYYAENRVRYLSLDGTKGYAIVEASRTYEVSFEYTEGEISDLICGCFCCGRCSHEFAAMLQLKELLEIINENYKELYEETGYFAAINKRTLLSLAVDGKKTGSFTL